MPLLLSFLSPEYPATKQTSSGDLIKAIITISANASQNEASCIGPNDLTRQLVSEKCVQDLINDMLKGGNPLTVGVGIVIEVIRKNNSDYDPDVGGADSIPSSRDPIYLGTLLKLFAQNVPNFMDLITQSYTVLNEDGTRSEKKRELKAAFGGTIEPLGFDRFKTCELMAELLHCSNMGLLNEKGGERYIRERDRERDRLRADRERENFSAEGGSECNGGNEGVVVEKAPLQVQNGGIETEEDAMNEDEFEDVAVSALLDEVREGRQSKAEDKERQSGDIKEVEENKTRKEAEARKSTEEEDLFVDEPLSPPASPYNDSKASETVEAKPTSPSAPARILADNIPPLDVTPIPGPPQDGGVSVSPTSSGLTAGFGGLGVQDDSKVEEFKPPVPEKDRVDEKTKTGASKEVVKDASKDVSGETAKEHAIEEGPEEKATTEDILKSDVPRAPSPPPTEGDDDTKPIKGANPLIADLNSPSTPPPLQAQAAQSVPITIERLNADVPPLPQEAEQPQNPFEEDLMDITAEDLPPPPPKPFVNVTPIGSSIDEYECMIERDLDGNPVVGDLLKIKFVEHRVVPTILEFFFRFPWNNFLHNVVYDVVQQVFNGPMERGYNRALAIDLFLTGRITERIVEGQRMSDKVQAEKNMRLGYMGHLTLIAEEVVKFTERHAAELLGQKVLDKVIDHSWIDYVEETLAATRERDNAILGGIRPDMALGPRQAVLNAVQAQAFNGNSNTGSLMLSGGGSSALDSIDLANGNAGLAGVGSSGGAGGLLSGFGSSSDEEDDDIMEHDDDDEVSRLGLSGSSDQVGDLNDLLFDDEIDDFFDDDMTFL
ncbi:sporulation-induced protein [Rhizina undulata]